MERSSAFGLKLLKALEQQDFYYRNAFRGLSAVRNASTYVSTFVSMFVSTFVHLNIRLNVRRKVSNFDEWPVEWIIFEDSNRRCSTCVSQCYFIDGAFVPLAGSQRGEIASEIEITLNFRVEKKLCPDFEEIFLQVIIFEPSRDFRFEKICGDLQSGFKDFALQFLAAKTWLLKPFKESSVIFGVFSSLRFAFFECFKLKHST